MKTKALFIISMVFCCLGAFAQNTDFPNAKRYEEENAAVTVRPRAVLLGDSITQIWKDADPDFFTDNNFLDRGISGQCTAQILCRMRTDVIALHPKYVVILAGINDVGLNEGASRPKEIVENIISMCELAKANRIKPVLCALTPSTYIGWRPEAGDVTETVKDINAQLQAYAKSKHIKFIDYFAGLDFTAGGPYTHDNVHPNAAGFKIMGDILLKNLK